MSPDFSPTRYVISTRRKAKRELLLLPAMNGTIGQLDQPELCDLSKGSTFLRSELLQPRRLHDSEPGRQQCCFRPQ